MRIAFTGKGGSGKTTVSSLFSRLAGADGYRVLALDADINQHMSQAIGYTGELRSMGMEAELIKEYLRGSNPHIAAGEVHKTTPPGNGSRLLTLHDDDWFIREFAVKRKNVFIAGAGDIPEGNIGVRCYHGLNGAVELVLGHMLDKQEDLVVVDMTAGADAFSSSLFTKVDVLVLVVEPTLKSLGVYEQFHKHVTDYGVPIVIVGNKVHDESDKKFITKRVGSVAAWIPPAESVRRRERGDMTDVIENDIREQLVALRDQLLKTSIDWKRREDLSHRMHIRAVEYPQIDGSFSLVDAAL
jgi:CO dehydrogenase maturation factor